MKLAPLAFVEGIRGMEEGFAGQAQFVHLPVHGLVACQLEGGAFSWFLCDPCMCFSNIMQRASMRSMASQRPISIQEPIGPSVSISAVTPSFTVDHHLHWMRGRKGRRVVSGAILNPMLCHQFRPSVRHGPNSSRPERVLLLL